MRGRPPPESPAGGLARCHTLDPATFTDILATLESADDTHDEPITDLTITEDDDGPWDLDDQTGSTDHTAITSIDMPAVNTNDRPADVGRDHVNERPSEQSPGDGADTAIDLLNRAIAIDRHTEAAYTRLIRAYLDAGEHDTARKIYRRLDSQLSKLGVSPSRQTRARVTAIWLPWKRFHPTATGTVLVDLHLA